MAEGDCVRVQRWGGYARGGFSTGGAQGQCGIAWLVCPRGKSSSAGRQEKGNFHDLLVVLSLLKFHSWSIMSLHSDEGERSIV